MFRVMSAQVVSQCEQGMDASDQAQMTMGIGLLKTVIELLACKGAEV